MSKSQTTYEWDIETVHVDGDILDHDHRDKLSEFGVEQLITAINRDNALDVSTHFRLALVCDKWLPSVANWERLWAYVDDEGKLPEFFSDSNGTETEVRVPKRFHVEFNR